MMDKKFVNSDIPTLDASNLASYLFLIKSLLGATASPPCIRFRILV